MTHAHNCRWARLTFVALATVVTISRPCHAITAQSESQEADEQLHQAEKLADQFVQRFGETLDFGVVYREMFVRDKVLRRRNVEMLVHDLVAKRLRDKLNYKTREETYVAFMNIFYVRWLFSLNVDGERTEKRKEYLPRDVMKEARKTAAGRCFLEVDGKCDDLPEEGFRTRRELSDFLVSWRRLSVLFRRHMPKHPFDTHAYKTNVHEIVWNNQAPGVSDGDDYFGVAKNRRVYEIARGMFCFNIINEQGKFRVVGLIFSD